MEADGFTRKRRRLFFVATLKWGMLCDERAVLDLTSTSGHVLLIEPPHKRKYVPLGLAKIATCVKARGGRVTFVRRVSELPPGNRRFDLVCISSLFTADHQMVVDSMRSARALDAKVPILVGGIAASLVPGLIDVVDDNCYVFRGYSRALDAYVPDYSVDWKIEEKWRDFSFSFTSRGCTNRCPYCAVWRIEADQWINPYWRHHLTDDKPLTMISDNNMSACPTGHQESLLNFLVEKRKRVTFDNGLDCKHITPELAAMLARVGEL